MGSGGSGASRISTIYCFIHSKMRVHIFLSSFALIAFIFETSTNLVFRDYLITCSSATLRFQNTVLYRLPSTPLDFLRKFTPTFAARAMKFKRTKNMPQLSIFPGSLTRAQFSCALWPSSSKGTRVAAAVPILTLQEMNLRLTFYP